MSILMLEVFDKFQTSSNTTIISADLATFETEKALAFDHGYQEGFSAGQGKVAVERERIQAAITAFQESQAQVIGDVRQEILQALQPLLEGLIGSVLPMAARASLLPLAVESILDMAAGALPSHFSIAINSEEFEHFSDHFKLAEMSDFSIIKNDALTLGQYEIRFEDREGLLDIPRLQKELLNLIRAFFSLDDTRGQHG